MAPSQKALRVASAALLLAGWAVTTEAAVTATPPVVQAAPGNVTSPTTVTLAVSPRTSGTGTIAITGLPAGATPIPAIVTYSYGIRTSSAVTSFQISLNALTRPGTYQLTIEDRTLQAGSTTITLIVTSPPGPVPGPDPGETAPAPVITAVAPASLAAGTPNAPVHVIGRNFDRAARVVVDTRGIQILGARVVSSTLVEITLALRDDATPGPHEIRIVNPDGQEAKPSGRFAVRPAGALGSEPRVARLAIQFPQPGAFVGIADRLKPIGLIVVTGTGTVTGNWVLDGVPFDRFSLYSTAGVPLHVTSRVPIPLLLAGEHRLELVIDSPQKLSSGPLTLVGVAESRSALRLLVPDDGARLQASSPPTFRWTLVPGATGYEVEIDELGADDRQPRRFRVSEATFTPDERTWTRIGTGARRWRVRPIFVDETRGEPSQARELTLLSGTSQIRAIALSDFMTVATRVAAGTRQEVPAGNTAPAEAAGAIVNWNAAAQATMTGWVLPEGAATSAAAGGPAIPPGNVSRGQIGLQADVVRGTGTAAATGDFAARHQWDEPRLVAQDNRNWLAAASAQRGFLSAGAKLGLGSPAFADQAEFVTSGLPRIGLQGLAGVRSVKFIGYHSLDVHTQIVGGAQSLDQTVRGAGLSVEPEGGRHLLRASMIDVNSKAGPLTTGGKGTVTGVLGRLSLGDAVTLLIEAAHGGFTPATDQAPLDIDGAKAADGIVPSQIERSGYAWRVSVAGRSAKLFAISLNLRQTDNSFSNPANPGFTAGGVAGLRSGDVAISQGFKGGSSIAINLRHTDNAVAPEDGAPKLNNNGGDLTFSLRRGPRVTLTMVGNAAWRHADAYAALSLPETDARDLGGSLTLTETAGALTVSQIGSYQRTDDHVSAYGDNRTIAGTVSANGIVGTRLILSAVTTMTRSQGDPALGATYALTASAQPSVQIQDRRVTFQPTLSYALSKNAVTGVEQTMEQYGGLLTWSPAWVRSLLVVQLQADWSRQKYGVVLDPPSDAAFSRRVAGALTLRWGGGQGMQLAPGSSVPITPTGATPLSAMLIDAAQVPLVPTTISDALGSLR